MFSYYIIVLNYIPKKNSGQALKWTQSLDVSTWTIQRDAPAGASESGETLLCRLLEDRGLVDTEQGFLSEGWKRRDTKILILNLRMNWWTLLNLRYGVRNREEHRKLRDSTILMSSKFSVCYFFTSFPSTQKRMQQYEKVKLHLI